jgi:hypothetical protein
MASTQLNLKEVPSVANARVADIKTDDGVNLLAFAVNKNMVHLVPAGGPPEGFGGITVAGPDVTIIAMNWTEVAKAAFELWELAHQKAAQTGGGGGQECTTTVTTITDANGKQVGVSVTQVCHPVGQNV